MSKKNKKSTRVKQHIFDLKSKPSLEVLIGEKEVNDRKLKRAKKIDSKLKVKGKKGVKVGKKVKIGGKLSQSEKFAVAKAMDIDC